MKLCEIQETKSAIKRINRSEIPETIKFLSNVLAVPRAELHIVGSGGKIDDSGDIDVAIDINKYNPEHIDKVLKAHGFHGKYNERTKIGTYNIPVKGEPSNGFVQVDITYTPNTEWSKFASFSAGPASRYKGIVRTALLSSVAAVINEFGVDYLAHSDDGRVISRAGRTFDLHSGLRRVYQYRPRKEQGEGYEDHMKDVSPEDFTKMHPGVNLKPGKTLIDDPEKVVKALFGKGVTTKDVESAEQVIHLIKTRLSPEVQRKVFKLAANKLKSFRGKIRLPDEVAQYETK